MGKLPKRISFKAESVITCMCGNGAVRACDHPKGAVPDGNQTIRIRTGGIWSMTAWRLCDDFTLQGL